MTEEHPDDTQHADNAILEETMGEKTPEDSMEEYQAEIARYKDMYLRAMAETENLRARSKRENEDTAKYAATRFARDMVGVLDNITRAYTSISEDAKAASDVVKQVAEGIDMTVKDLLNIFERNGIRRIEPFAEKFDHNFHQAVAQVESAEAEPGTVLQVLQAGYVLHDRLLRPAMVTVVAAAPPKTEAAGNAA